MHPLAMNMGVTPEYGYNSGVIVMNLKMLRETENLYSDLEKFMEKNSRSFYLPDQTTINRFFEGRITEIGREWNFPPTPGDHDPMLGKAAIWHFYNRAQNRIKLSGTTLDSASPSGTGSRRRQECRRTHASCR